MAQEDVQQPPNTSSSTSQPDVIEKPVNSTATNDNSNPQQGTGGSTKKVQRNSTTTTATATTTTTAATTTTTAATTTTTTTLPPTQQQSFKIPATKRDARKLFVGGLPSDVTDHEFRCFFEQFGVVLDSVVMFDRETHRSRGFGFVTFLDAEVSKTLLQSGKPSDGVGRLVMRGKTCEIKAAEPKSAGANNTHHNQRAGPGGGGHVPFRRSGGNGSGDRRQHQHNHNRNHLGYSNGHHPALGAYHQPPPPEVMQYQHHGPPAEALPTSAMMNPYPCYSAPGIAGYMAPMYYQGAPPNPPAGLGPSAINPHPSAPMDFSAPPHPLMPPHHFMMEQQQQYHPGVDPQMVATTSTGGNANVLHPPVALAAPNANMPSVTPPTMVPPPQTAAGGGGGGYHHPQAYTFIPFPAAAAAVPPSTPMPYPHPSVMQPVAPGIPVKEEGGVNGENAASTSSNNVEAASSASN